MPIRLEYMKTSETGTEVEYTFGRAKDGATHRLVIPKLDPSSTRLPDGVSSALSGKVIGRVVSRAQQDGTWPDRGFVQS